MTTSPSVFHLEQAIRRLEDELKILPPFSVPRLQIRAEIDQLKDMLDRRRDRPAC